MGRSTSPSPDSARLTTLVNNAAILHIAPLEHTSVDDYLRVSRVNELGTFLGIRSAIAPMRANGGGSIVNISSIDGHHAAPGTSAYCASKFAVRGLTKTAALELGRYGIRVNSVNPAAGSDEMLEPLLPGVDVRAMRDDQERRDPPPIGRRGRVEDVAATVAFLASDDSAFYTGADFDLDGGITAGMKVKGAIPGAPPRTERRPARLARGSGRTAPANGAGNGERRTANGNRRTSIERRTRWPAR